MTLAVCYINRILKLPIETEELIYNSIDDLIPADSDYFRLYWDFCKKE